MKDIASTIKGQIAAPHNQINIFSTSIEDLISAWHYKQGQLKTCRTSPKVHTRALPSSRHMSVAYHGHGQVKKVRISSMNDLYEYLSVHKDKVSYAKNNLAPLVSPVLDAFVLARVTGDLGITGKVIPKVINGRQYIVFSGHPGLRSIFTGPIYKVNNMKIVNMAIGTLGMAKSIAKGTFITILLTIPLTVFESILTDPGNLYALVGHVASEITKIGITALMMGIAGLVLTSFKIYALLSGGLVIIIGLGISAMLNNIDDRYKLTEKLIEALESLAYKAQGAAQTAGEGIWGGIIDPGGLRSTLGGPFRKY